MGSPRLAERLTRHRIGPVVIGLWLSVIAAAPGPPTPSLETMLERLSRVAELYRDQALRFTCDESIYFTGHGDPVLHKFKYIYRHGDGKLEDYRVPRGRGEKRSDEENEKIALDNYGLPTYLLRAYSWVFIFTEETQPRYRFEDAGVDTVFGRPAMRVRFEAVPPYDDDYNVWFGAAWVDPTTSQLLKVEALHLDDREEQAAMDEALEESRYHAEWPHRPSYTYVTHLTEFDEVENGLRFPGRVLIRQVRYEIVRRGRGWTSVENPIYQVSQTYKRYRFFGVRTEQEIQRFVGGGSEDGE